MADDDEPVLGPCDGDIDPVVLREELAWRRPDSRDEYQVVLSTLAAVDRNHLIFHSDA